MFSIVYRYQCTEFDKCVTRYTSEFFLTTCNTEGIQIEVRLRGCRKAAFTAYYCTIVLMYSGYQLKRPTPSSQAVLVMEECTYYVDQIRVSECTQLICEP